ncbi:hypothetical protein QN324_04530 [Streptococcus agalactiae]|uniref:hypothetical protein n=1 Tax=Streptococcus agalactiae TaxID=1311 RepID=UPI003F1886E4
MSRKAIRTAAVDKVNELLGWNCETVEEIKFAIGHSVENARKVSQAIDDLKVCDPAVGSGHFLVSILNEIIALKSDLNILFDADGNYIGNLIQCYVINDELVIQDMSGNNFCIRQVISSQNKFKRQFSTRKGIFWKIRSLQWILTQARSIFAVCVFGLNS